MKVSFVIPCYRSEGTIGGVVGELKGVLSLRPSCEYEIIMVSDKSPDNVYSVIEEMCANDPLHLKGLELARNFGQHAALMAGYSRTSGDVVVSLDDDGQAPVESVFQLVDAVVGGGADVAYGTYANKKHGLFRNMGSRVNDWMVSWLLGKPLNIKVTSFFAAKRFVIDEMLRYKQAFPYVIGLVFRTTRSIVNIPVDHRARASGESGYTVAKLLGLWINGLTAFSVKPLRIASMAGLLCAASGFGFGLWAIINKIFIHPDAPMGYSSLMAAVLFIGGMLMLILGLIGEYLGRIYICINSSPQYVVSKEIS